MTYDSSNPFHQLANIFPPRKARQGQSGQSGRPSTGKEHAPREESFRSDTDVSPEEHFEDDASLFLRAMNAGDFAQNPGKGGWEPVPEAARKKRGRKRAAGNCAQERCGNQTAPAPPEELDAFDGAMRGVVPITGKTRVARSPDMRRKETPPPDPAGELRDLLEGKIEFALEHAAEYMEGYAVGIDPLVRARLRGGRYSPEAHLDMHGMTAGQALDALIRFIKSAYQRGLRTVIIVTGRGKNSPGGVGVLRPLLQQWLCREPFKRVVLAFCTAKPGDGGLGAVYVLLRKFKKSRGKIIWDYTPADNDFPDL